MTEIVAFNLTADSQRAAVDALRPVLTSVVEILDDLSPGSPSPLLVLDLEQLLQRVVNDTDLLAAVIERLILLVGALIDSVACEDDTDPGDACTRLVNQLLDLMTDQRPDHQEG